MLSILKLIAAAIVGYLLGSVSSAVIVSKVLNKKDVRNYGSGNAGATNVARVFGMGAGIATFVCDGLKTAAAMLLGRLIGGEYGFLIAGGMCLIGHCFPVYFGFKGGKGVTVGAVIGLMLSWKMFLILLAVFIVTVVITKRVSAASLACAVAFPISEYIVGQRGVYQMILGFVAMICVIVMHRENIKRLINGTEPVFKAGKKK